MGYEEIMAAIKDINGPWSNAACRGYCRMAMKSAGVDEKTQKQRGRAKMDRYMIVIPAKNRAFNMKCDDGDSMKLETLQKLVGGPIKPVNSVLSAEWAREKDVDGILLLVNEEGMMKERPLTNQRASEMTAAELVGPAVVAAKRGDELIGFAKPVVDTICAEWL